MFAQQKWKEAKRQVNPTHSVARNILWTLRAFNEAVATSESASMLEGRLQIDLHPTYKFAIYLQPSPAETRPWQCRIVVKPWPEYSAARQSLADQIPATALH
jgi:hypothetical protein